MATSGIYNFTMTRDEIVNAALSKVGLPHTSMINAETRSIANNELQRLVQHLSAQQLKLWAHDEGVIIFEPDTVAYSLADVSGTDTVFKASGLVYTKIGADEASAQTVLTLDSTAGMAASDVILIELDDGTLHKTTIVSVDDATTVTVTDALADSAADGNAVYSYTASTDLVDGVKRVLGCRACHIDGTEIAMNELSRQDYYNIVDKTLESGIVTGYYIDYLRDCPVIYLWPSPSSLQYFVKFSYEKGLEQFNLATDNPDFPPEWNNVLVWNLAACLLADRGKAGGPREQNILLMADKFLREMQRVDNKKRGPKRFTIVRKR